MLNASMDTYISWLCQLVASNKPQRCVVIASLNGRDVNACRLLTPRNATITPAGVVITQASQLAQMRTENKTLNDIVLVCRCA
jgi:hypothetical protein